MTRNTIRYMIMLTACASIFCLDAADQKSGVANSAAKKAVPTKIAFVDMRRIITTDAQSLSSVSHEWKDLFNKVLDTLKPADKELNELSDKFEKAKNEFESLQKSGLTSKEALGRKYEEAGRLEYELRARIQERDNYAQSELAKAQSQIGPKIENVIKTIKKNQGWNAILRSDLLLGDADSEFDVTEEVLSSLNNQYAQEKKAKEEQDKKAAKPASAAQAA